MFRIIGAALSLALTAGAAHAEGPVKHRFGAAGEPSGGPAAAHGGYAKGCLEGGGELPATGESWQAMRLSRNRNWGHPAMIGFIERLGEAAKGAGWPGLLVGDISQPRGGPMTSGHRSHQIGIDADIWMRPGYDRELTRAEREKIGSFTVTTPDHMSVNDRFTPAHVEVLKAAASDFAVARIFVHAAIKQKLCEVAGPDRDWLRKIRPWWGHNAHFHVRLTCPVGSQGCENQASPPPGDGCDETLAWWFSDEARNPKPKPGAKPKPRRELRLADLPQACERVLEGG